jgi:hypothetical protein
VDIRWSTKDYVSDGLRLVLGGAVAVWLITQFTSGLWTALAVAFVAANIAHGVLAWRAFAVSDGEVLVVRNTFRSREVPRREIEGFTTAKRSRGESRLPTIRVELQDGTKFYLDAATGIGKRRVGEQLVSLNTWLHQGARRALDN